MFIKAFLILAICGVLFTTVSSQQLYRCDAVDIEEYSCREEIDNSTQEILRRLTDINMTLQDKQCNCCEDPTVTPPPRANVTDTGTCACDSFEANILSCCSIGTPQNPAASCQDLAARCSCATSGNYWIRNTVRDAVLVYCDLEVHADDRSCGGSRGWMRVANLNMNNTQCNSCPQPLVTISPPGDSSRRLCTRVENRRMAGCDAVPYSVQGVEYSRVCGKVIGYQREAPDGFIFYDETNATIDEEYVDGVSITHGQSGHRTHIWTFAAAQSEFADSRRACPCTEGETPSGDVLPLVPPYIGRNFFCDTGSQATGVPEDRFHLEAPLWDGRGCGRRSTCCQFNRPPYFRTDIAPTTDNIDVRLCASFRTGNRILRPGVTRSREDTPLEVIELYVQ